MKRPLKPEEVRIWTVVASTVRPAPGRSLPSVPSEEGGLQRYPLTPAKAGAQPSHPQRLVEQRRQVHLGPRLSLSSGSATPRPGGGNERDEKAVRERSETPKTPDPIEPLRKRRIARERDPIEARLDLHGLDQDRARLAVHGFLQRAHAQGLRAVLVITGKGTLGDGALRRRTPDWLSEPQVRPLIAGFSPAERHHGGDGALYIALKRRRA